MNKRKGFMAGFLAATAMLGFLAVFAFLALQTVPEGNRDFFNMALVALIGLVGTAFGYYLGSSEGSARKNDLFLPEATPPAPPSGPEAGFARVSLLWISMVLLGGTLLLTPMLFGCSALQTKSKDGLATQALLSAQAAVVGMAQAADQMCTQGTLTQSDCDQVAQIYEQAQVSYDLAGALLIVALEADTPEAWQNYQALHDRFFQLYTSLNAAAVEFKILPAIEGGAR
ncbi:hypothetical protein [Pseudomonas sp.]|uniref:hypothetical protein n=1 Tax=Pseudomonas sp. TaxID=306 RepID=UPI003D0CBC92